MAVLATSYATVPIGIGSRQNYRFRGELFCRHVDIVMAISLVLFVAGHSFWFGRRCLAHHRHLVVTVHSRLKGFDAMPEAAKDPAPANHHSAKSFCLWQRQRGGGWCYFTCRWTRRGGFRSSPPSRTLPLYDSSKSRTPKNAGNH